MPTYEYHCESCGKLFTKSESISRHTQARPACPKCKSKKVSQVFGPFYAKTVKKS
jgi:putative FmdB family regulatory protein